MTPNEALKSYEDVQILRHALALACQRKRDPPPQVYKPPAFPLEKRPMTPGLQDLSRQSL
jgi:hypothetical protein